jgi:hypothetical protein
MREYHWTPPNAIPGVCVITNDPNQLHPETGLPIFEGATIVSDLKGPMAHIQQGSESHFVRKVRFHIKTQEAPPLGTCLHVADRELNAFSKLCGVHVVEHWWGLVPQCEVAQDRSQLGPCERSQRGIAPPGFLVVARVAAIRPLPVGELRERIQRLKTQRANILYERRRTVDGYRQADHTFRQLTYGQAIGTTTAPGWIYHDIEPFIYR